MTKVRDTLGPYRLTRLIRADNSYQFWEAEANGKRHVLKILRSDKRNDKTELARLKHEYEVAGPLVSPRIIRVQEMRTENATPFLVMETFSDVSIKSGIKRGPEGIAVLLPKIIEQGAEGLYFLHGKGWLHCDVKPENFLINAEGDCKLIDFSIAEKKKSGLGKLLGGKKTAQGTRSYMSPEQIRCDPLDERTDVYSFGCVLYEALVGKPPYTGSTPQELLNKHMTAPPPSALVGNENVSTQAAELIKRMLAKQREQRPATMWEFLKEFRAIKLFKTPPRKPEFDIFSEVSSTKSPDQLIRTPEKPL